MSYEGYEQVLCEKGHLIEFDAHDEGWDDDPICDCGGRFVWCNSVDITNTTSPEEHGIGYIELEVLQEGERCSHCNSQIGKTTYKIPHDAGQFLEPCFRCGSRKYCECWEGTCKECSEPLPLCNCNHWEKCQGCGHTHAACRCSPFQEERKDDEEEFGVGLK